MSLGSGDISFELISIYLVVQTLFGFLRLEVSLGMSAMRCRTVRRLSRHAQICRCFWCGCLVDD